MDFIQQLKAFNRLTDDLNPAAIAIYFKLFMAANQKHWPEWFDTNDRYLSKGTGIKRGETIRKALDTLKEHGLILFERGCQNRPTRYHLNPLFNSEMEEGIPRKNRGIEDEVPLKIRGIDEQEPRKNRGIIDEVPLKNRGIQQIVPRKNRTKLKHTIKHNNKTILQSEDCTQDKTPYGEIIGRFCTLCPSLQKPKQLTEARRKAIKARWQDLNCDWNELDAFFKEVESSDFLTGRDGKWPGSRGIDWIMKQANFVKIREGNYKNRSGPKAGNINPFEAALRMEGWHSA